MTEADGRAFEEDIFNGQAKFCDLGSRPVKVETRSTCPHKAVVENLKLTFGQQEHITLLLDDRRCFVDHLGGTPACLVLLRVRRSNGKPVADAPVDIVSPRPRQERTDEFGRAYLSFPVRNFWSEWKVLKGTVGGTPFELSCGRMNVPQDKIVVVK